MARARKSREFAAQREQTTLAALNAKLAADDLELNWLYEVTQTEPTLGTITVTFRAVDTNQLARTVYVSTTFDANAWEGEYDLSTGKLTLLKDQLGNTCIGSNTIDTYPWGWPLNAENTFKGVTFNSFSGNIVGCYVRDSTLSGSVVAYDSTITNSNISMFNAGLVSGIRDSIIDNALLSLDNCPLMNIDRTRIAGLSSINMTNAANLSIRDSTIDDQSTIVGAAGCTLLFGFNHLSNRGIVSFSAPNSLSLYYSKLNGGGRVFSNSDAGTANVVFSAQCTSQGNYMFVAASDGNYSDSCNVSGIGSVVFENTKNSDVLWSSSSEQGSLKIASSSEFAMSYCQASTSANMVVLNTNSPGAELFGCGFHADYNGTITKTTGTTTSALHASGSATLSFVDPGPIGSSAQNF